MKKISKHKYFTRFSFNNKSSHNKKRLICNEIIKLESKNNKFYINTFSKELYLLKEKNYKSRKDTTKSQKQYLKHKKQNKKEIYSPILEIIKIEKILLKNDYPIFKQDKYDWRKYWKKSKFFPNQKDYCLSLLSSHKKIQKNILRNI